MSGAKEAVARVSDALDTCIPQMHNSLHRRKEALRVPRLDVHTSQAELEPYVQNDLRQVHEQAHKACVDARSDPDKPGLWEEVLGTCIWTKMHTYIRSFASVEDVVDRLDMALSLAQHHLADASLPLSALEEVLDESTVPACADLFAYAELRASLLTQEMVPTSGKGLIFLRLCNKLLRRLSKTHREHTILAGRVLVLLSSTFAVNERSGVNLKGEFGSRLVEPLHVTPSDAPSNTAPDTLLMHPQFYATFWALQAYFMCPARLWQQDEAPPGAQALKILTLLPSDTPSPMKTFQVGIQCVLDVFWWLHKTTDPSLKPHPIMLDETQLASAYPHYLSDRNLFAYELQNMAFQRQFLIQCLITFQYLLGQTSASHEHTQAWKNKLLVPTHTLCDADEQWVRKTWRQVQTLLRDSAKDGKVFLDAALLLLRRESSWIRWKGAGAPSIYHDAFPAETLRAWSDKIATVFSVQEPWYPHAVGTAELSRIWADGLHIPASSSVEVRDEEGQTKTVITDGWEDLEFPPHRPSVHTLCRMMEQCPDTDKVQSLAWRALRCVGRDHLHLLACIKSLDDIPSLLQVMEDEMKGVPYEPEHMGQEPMVEEDIPDEDMPPAHEETHQEANPEEAPQESLPEEAHPDAHEESPQDTHDEAENDEVGDDQTHQEAASKEAEDAPSSVLSSSSSSPLSSSGDADNGDADATFMTAPPPDVPSSMDM